MYNMSASQDQYISSLKKIKQVEEKAQKEIDNYKSKIEDKIIQLESELEKAIAVGAEFTSFAFFSRFKALKDLTAS